MSRAPRASRSPSRPELSAAERRSSGAPRRGATDARPAEAEAYEREYPGASWLASRLMRELEIVGGRCEALIADVGRRYGLSHAALNALAVIEGSGGPLAAGEISAHMHITTGSMTSLLDTLERKGYVQRLLDPDDRRRVLVDVTPDGQEVLDLMLPEVQQVATATLAPLGDETLQALLTSLAAVSASIAAVPDDLPTPPPRRKPARLKRS